MPTVRMVVTLKPSLLDSAGRTVAQSLLGLGFEEVQGVRIGKMIELEVTQVDQDRLHAMAQQLLANPVIEDYRFEVVPEPTTA